MIGELVMVDAESNLLAKGQDDIAKLIRFHIKNMFGAKATKQEDLDNFVETISKTIDDEWMIQSNSPEVKEQK